MATLVYQTVAHKAANGPLVETLSTAQIAELSYDYLMEYPAFLTKASQLINQKVQTIEAHEPEGQRNELTIAGWNGTAATAANTINHRWQAGQVTGTDGTAVKAWPEYPTQLAWAPDGNTLVLRWLKEEWQLYLLVFVLIATVGYLVYRVLTGGSYTLQTATPQTKSGSNPVIQTQGGLRIFGVKWYWWVGGAGTLAVAPWGYKKIVELKQDEAGSLAADRAIRRERG